MKIALLLLALCVCRVVTVVGSVSSHRERRSPYISLDKRILELEEELIEVKSSLRKQFADDFDEAKSSLRKMFAGDLNVAKSSLRKKFADDLYKAKSSLRKKIARTQRNVEDNLKYKILPTMLPDRIHRSVKEALKTKDVDSIIQGHYTQEIRTMKKRMKDLLWRIRIQDQKLQEAMESNLLLEEKFQKRLPCECSDTGVIERSQTTQVDQIGRKHEQAPTIVRNEDVPLPVPSSTARPSTPWTASSHTSSAILSTQTTAPATAKTTPLRNATLPSSILGVQFQGSEITKYDMKRKSTTVIPFYSDIIEMAYDGKTQKLYWCEYGRKKIRSGFLNKTGVAILKGNVRSRALAVDSGRGMLVYADYQGRVNMMTVKGKGDRMVAQLPRGFSVPWSIVLDTSRRVIYVAHKEQIFKVSYSGVEVETFLTGYDMWGLAFDPLKGVLYFTDSKVKSINRISISQGENSVSVIRKGNHDPRELVYYNNSIFVSYFWHGGVDILSLGGEDDEIGAFSVKTERYKTVLICLGP